MGSAYLMEGTDTNGALYILRTLSEGVVLMGGDMYVCFVACTGAFDKARHE